MWAVLAFATALIGSSVDDARDEVLFDSEATGFNRTFVQVDRMTPAPHVLAGMKEREYETGLVRQIVGGRNVRDATHNGRPYYVGVGNLFQRYVQMNRVPKSLARENCLPKIAMLRFTSKLCVFPPNTSLNFHNSVEGCVPVVDHLRLKHDICGDGIAMVRDDECYGGGEASGANRWIAVKFDADREPWPHTDYQLPIGNVGLSLGVAGGNERCLCGKNGKAERGKQKKCADANKPGLFLGQIGHPPGGFIHSLLREKIVYFPLIGLLFAALAGIGLAFVIVDNFDRNRPRKITGWALLGLGIPVWFVLTYLGLYG